MATQTYANHRHNPKMTGITGGFFLISLVGFGLRWFQIGGRYSMAAGLVGVLGAIWMLLSISRVYITKLQDRIIKLEMRVRAMSVLSPAQQAVMASLAKPQIVA